MSKKFLLVLGVLAVIIGMGLNSAIAAGAEFSADMIMTDAKDKIASGKIFIKGFQKIRQEINVEGETNVTILRLDKKVSWTLMPEKQYMEVSFPFDPNQPNKEVEYVETTIGNETVNGYACKVIQYTYKDKKLGVLIQWYSESLGFAVKTQTKDSKGKINSTVEYKNIKQGTQPDSLFEIPAGYQKFSLPFKIPGM